jgi:hypothetical protein
LAGFEVATYGRFWVAPEVGAFTIGAGQAHVPFTIAAIRAIMQATPDEDDAADSEVSLAAAK